MKYGNILENGEAKRRNEVALSVQVDECCICYDCELGTARTTCFDSGILRIYADVRRIEFKCHGGEEDGVIYGFPLDLVRWYTYKPKKNNYYFKPLDPTAPQEYGQPLPDFQ